MAPTVILAKAGIQFFRSPAWMPACAGMTNWVALVAAYGAHVHLAHISPNLASPEGEGFQPSPKETLRLCGPPHRSASAQQVRGCEERDHVTVVINDRQD